MKKRQISVLVAQNQKSWRDGLRFWMQIPAAEVARGLRECIWAHDSAIFSIFLFFSCFLCCVLMAFFQFGPFVQRFPFFAFGILMGLFHKIVFSVSFMRNALWGHVACSWRFVTSEHKIDFSHFFFVALSAGFYKNVFFHFFDEESVLVTCGVLCPCYRGKARSGPSGAHRGNQRPVWLHRALVNSHFFFVTIHVAVL